jgi:hypothetical protein
VVAVLDFEAVGLSESEVQEYADYFSFILRQTGEYQVIDREQRERILREKEFVEEDRKDEKYQKRIAAVIGADLIVTGKVHGYKDGFTLEVKLIEVESGRILNIASREYFNTQELFDDCQKLVQVFFKEQIQNQRTSSLSISEGLFSGLGIITGNFSVHIPAGLYVELIYPRWTIFTYVYWGFLNDVLFVEMSSGYRIRLTTKMNLIPFGGIALYILGPELIEENSYVCFTGGLNWEFILHEHWKLNIRTNCSLPFLLNPFEGALLNLTIGAGYKF